LLAVGLPTVTAAQHAEPPARDDLTILPPSVDVESRVPPPRQRSIGGTPSGWWNLDLRSAADSPASQPSPSLAPAFRQAVEVVGGYAGFLDEGLVDHVIAGATVRYRLGRIISLGPEIVFMIGPGTDRDVFLTGNVTFDFLVPADGPRPGTVSPFVVAGGGLMIHRTRFGGSEFSTTEGAVTGGGGVRVWITRRIYAMGAYRAGWEPHMRIDGGIGVTW
jgi:hypothetical protein